MSGSSEALNRVFAALADPSRRAILARLSEGPATSGELATPLCISKPAVSQHLKVLEDAGLITRTRQAQWRSCALRTEPLDEAADWIRQQRAAWEERFDALEERLRQLRGEEDDG